MLYQVIRDDKCWNTELGLEPASQLSAGVSFEFENHDRHGFRERSSTEGAKRSIPG